MNCPKCNKEILKRQLVESSGEDQSELILTFQNQCVNCGEVFFSKVFYTFKKENLLFIDVEKYEIVPKEPKSE